MSLLSSGGAGYSGASHDRRRCPRCAKLVGHVLQPRVTALNGLHREAIQSVENLPDGLQVAACSIKRRNRAVKLGDFTALTIPTEGGAFHRNKPEGANLGVRAAPPTEACWLMLTRGGKILVGQMGHEGTGEAHH